RSARRIGRPHAARVAAHRRVARQSERLRVAGDGRGRVRAGAVHLRRLVRFRPQRAARLSAGAASAAATRARAHPGRRSAASAPAAGADSGGEGGRRRGPAAARAGPASAGPSFRPRSGAWPGRRRRGCSSAAKAGAHRGPAAAPAARAGERGKGALLLRSVRRPRQTRDPERLRPDDAGEGTDSGRVGAESPGVALLLGDIAGLPDPCCKARAGPRRALGLKRRVIGNPVGFVRLSLALLAAGLLALAAPARSQTFTSAAEVALIEDYDSGAVLYEKNADQPTPPASTA